MANFVLPATEPQMMDDLVTWAAANAAVGDEAVAEFIAKQAAAVPVATATDLGATTDVAKAWITCKLAYSESTDTNPGTTVVPGSTGRSGSSRVKARPTSRLTSAQEAALQAHVNSTLASKNNVSVNTTIPAFFIARPASNDYIDEGTKGTIKADSWKSIQDKITSGEYVVVADFPDKQGNMVPSKTNYDMLVTAAAQKTATVDVMRTDKIGASVGYNVLVSDGAETAPEVQIMPKARMQHFIEMKAAGYIKAGGDTLGVMLRELTVKSKDPSQAETKRVVLSDTNKKAAVAANNYISIREVLPSMENKTQKANLVFYVNKAVIKQQDGKNVVTKEMQKDTKGNVRKFAIRVSVECSVHQLAMKKEYEGLFPTGKIDPTKPLDGENLAKVAAATARDLAITLSDRASTFTVDPTLQDELDKLRAVISADQAAPQNVMV